MASVSDISDRFANNPPHSLEIAFLSASVLRMTDKPVADTVTLISPGEAAEKLHVTTKTLQRMAIRGEVKAVVLPSGHRRYRLDDIEAFMAGAA